MEQARHVAKLARLELDDRTLARYAEQLTAVLGYMDAIGTLKLEGVSPMTYPSETADVWREDTPAPGLAPSQFLSLTPDADPPFLKVPKVLGDSAGA